MGTDTGRLNAAEMKWLRSTAGETRRERENKKLNKTKRI
jgi:hypothetical protein